MTKENTQIKVWPITIILAIAVVILWAFWTIPAILKHEQPRLDRIRKNAPTERINPKTDTPVTDISSLTPKQLGLLNVGLSMDNLARPSKTMASRKMAALKREIGKQAFIATIPAELPRSMKGKRTMVAYNNSLKVRVVSVPKSSRH